MNIIFIAFFKRLMFLYLSWLRQCTDEVYYVRHTPAAGFRGEGVT